MSNLILWQEGTTRFLWKRERVVWVVRLSPPLSCFFLYGMWRRRRRRTPLIHWLRTIVKFSNATVEGTVRLKIMEDLRAIDAVSACDFLVQCCRGQHTQAWADEVY